MRQKPVSDGLLELRRKLVVFSIFHFREGVFPTRGLQELVNLVYGQLSLDITLVSLLVPCSATYC